MKYINTYTRILLEFQKIPKAKKHRTFMEISGYPHYENVCSNILQFFLNPYNEHGLKDLVLNSLVWLVEPEFQFDSDIESIEVEREVQTLRENRLDILIRTENYVIGIENKIFHFLNNDLSDYAQTIKSYCNQPNKKALNIILSLNRLSNSEDISKAKAYDFFSITYEDLFKSIREEMGKFISHSNPTYFIYLSDFMKSIENLKPSTMENKQLWSFFKENKEAVQELTQKYNEYRSILNGKVTLLKQLLPPSEFSPTVDRQWIYKELPDHCLVYDYTIEGTYKVSIDAWITPNGWEIHLFGRGKPANSSEYLFGTMCQHPDFLPKPFSQYEKNERLVFDRFEVDADLEKVAESLKNLLARIENYKEQLQLEK